MGPGEYLLDQLSRPKPVCYLDLDGVLVNFVAGAFKVHRRSITMDDVKWDFCTQIGFDGIHDPDFWLPLNREFWAGLNWHEDGRALLESVERLFGENVVLMTSPCDTPGCVDGKLDWIRQHLPNYRRRFFVGPAKHLAAGPGKLLIDDHDANVEKFRAHGGRAILVPRPWNTSACHTLPGGAFCHKAVGDEVAWMHELMSRA